MYRENIYDVIQGTGQDITTLVIPKNTGLKGYAWKVLEEAGLPVGKAEQVGKNKLKVDNLTLLLRRGEDIPQIVVDEFRRGVIVLGLTGDDLFDEYRLKNPNSPLHVENTYDWFDKDAKFFRPALCLMNQSGRMDDMPLEARVAVNAKYEQTTRLFLSKAPQLKGRHFEVTTYEGDVESNVSDGINDCCIDTMYSGETIDNMKPPLKIAEIIRFSDLVVISALKR